MEFELGTGALTMMNRVAGEVHDWDEITSMSLEQEVWSPNEEQEKIIKGTFEPMTIPCEIEFADPEVFDELGNFSLSHGVKIECYTPILIQARWHNKARIRKKWLKRYGYKEDKIKTIINATCGELDAETGKLEFKAKSIECILKPHQLQREVK